MKARYSISVKLPNPRTEILEEHVIALSVVCETCCCEGKIDGKTCPDCEGYGSTVTENGSQILAFLHEFVLKAKKWE